MSTREISLDQFQKQSKLGEGTYGVVFKAIDIETNETVALKKIRIDDDDEGIPSTAIREIALLKDLSHKNIVSLLHVLFHRSQLYLVFEYLPYDLKKFMVANNNRLSIETIQSFSYQLLEGVDYCHSQRVLHRDLKPQNILVGSNGVIKLADFGLARAFSLPNRTWTHEVITLWYRPPEILLGTDTYTITADMWSLGAIIIEMINGTPLFHGNSEICQLMHIFKAIGTPNENIWNGVSRLKDYQLNFPQWKGKKWDELVPEPFCDDLGRDLLSRLVTLDPSMRITAKQALKHPYFDVILGRSHSSKSVDNDNDHDTLDDDNNNGIDNNENDDDNNDNLLDHIGSDGILDKSKMNNNDNNNKIDCDDDDCNDQIMRDVGDLENNKMNRINKENINNNNNINNINNGDVGDDGDIEVVDANVKSK